MEVLFICTYVLNFLFGYFFFTIRQTDTTQLFFKYALLTFLLSLLVFFSLKDFRTLQKVFLCIPLFVSFLPELVYKLTEHTRTQKNYILILVFLKSLHINLKLGRSFEESLQLAKGVLEQKKDFVLVVKKNVVLQQPKSSFCRVFLILEQDLNLLMEQKTKKIDLLFYILQKYQFNFELFKKQNLATTQYRFQSYVLIAMWLSGATYLIYTGSFIKYLGVFLISLLFLVLGSFFSKKLLIKSHFRI